MVSRQERLADGLVWTPHLCVDDRGRPQRRKQTRPVTGATTPGSPRRDLPANSDVSIGSALDILLARQGVDTVHIAMLRMSFGRSVRRTNNFASSRMKRGPVSLPWSSDRPSSGASITRQARTRVSCDYGDYPLIQAGITRGPTANLAAVRTKAMSAWTGLKFGRPAAKSALFESQQVCSHWLPAPIPVREILLPVP